MEILTQNLFMRDDVDIMSFRTLSFSKSSRDLFFSTFCKNTFKNAVFYVKIKLFLKKFVQKV